jgi:hypothetical protein
MSDEVAGLDWSAGRSVPAFQAPTHLDIYTIRNAAPDVQLTISTMAGVINRPQARVYLVSGDDDQAWLKLALGGVPQDVATATDNNALNAMLTAYRSAIQGVIIYDPSLNDTINIATMLAGVHDGIVVSPTQAATLQASHNLPVLVDLRVYKWRTALQVYHWAQQNLLSETSGRLIAGLNPSVTVGLRSFLVASRTFVYWLDSRKYLPDFSDGVLSERSLMLQILSSFAPGATHLGWFIDESSGVSLTSQAAMSVLASDFFSNLEVWAAIAPQASADVPKLDDVADVLDAANTVYVSFTISDGDNLQYCQHRLRNLWSDRARGAFPLGWTISPCLVQAAPAMAEYYMRTATPNDELIAGPSGAGYMFPSHWPDGQLDTFLQNTGSLMQEMGLTTLAVLDTDFWQSSGLPFISNIRFTGQAFTDPHAQQRYVQVLTPFGLQGILSGSGVSKPSGKKVKGVPFCDNLGLADSVNKTVRLIKNAAAAGSQRPLFLNVYMLAWTMTPSLIQQVIQQLGSGYQVVTPRTLLALAARTL